MSDLFAAIEAHDLDGIAALLAAGARPDVLQQGAPGWTPLHAAVEELEHGGGVEPLVLLLRAGAPVDAWDRGHDATPLRMALFRGQDEAVRLLLAAGADPNVVGAEGDSPLRCGATRTIDVPMAALLVTAGADPGALDGDHRTAAERLPATASPEREAVERWLARRA